jgi:hypothetical protein
MAMPIGFGLMILVYLELFLKSLATLIQPGKYAGHPVHAAWEKL